MRPHRFSLRPWRHARLVGCGAWLAGCALSPSTSTAPSEPIAQCFAGPGEITLPDNQRFPSHRLVARRTLLPDENRIIETVANFDLDGQEPPMLYELPLEIDGERFTFRAVDGSLVGEGTLEGPTWAWTGWRSETRLPNGAIVISEDRLDRDTLHVTKTGVSPDGTIEWTIHERLEAAPLEHCEAAFAPLRERVDAAPGDG